MSHPLYPDGRNFVPSSKSPAHWPRLAPPFTTIKRRDFITIVSSRRWWRRWSDSIVPEMGKFSRNFDTENRETSHMDRLNSNRYNGLNSSMFKVSDSNRGSGAWNESRDKELDTIGNFSPFGTNTRIEIKVYNLVVGFTVQRENFHPPRFHSLHFFYFSRHTCRYLVPTLFASREIIFTISTIVTRQPVSGRSYPPISIVLPRSWNPFSPFWLIDNDVCRTINLQKYFASSRVRNNGLKRKQLRSSHLSIVNVKKKKKIDQN